jgi:hypothetical protein
MNESNGSENEKDKNQIDNKMKLGNKSFSRKQFEQIAGFLSYVHDSCGC